MLNITIYEEYDGAIHGNQKYIKLLLEAFQESLPDSTHLQLVVPSRNDLYEKALSRGKVLSLDKSKWLHRVLSLSKVIRRSNTDVILCNNERSLITALFVSSTNKIPLVWYIKNLRKSLWSDLICFFFAKRVLVISPECVSIKNSIFSKYFSEKIFILNIGTQLEEFLNIPSAKFHNGPIRIALIASVSYNKGIDIALDAMNELDKHKVSADLRIAGSTPTKSKEFAIQMKKKSEKLQHINVEWLGWRGDISSLLGWADVVILPSRSEGVPRSVVEAMAAGRPVIASSIGGTPSIIQDGSTGFLINPEDYSALANRLIMLGRNFDIRYKIGGNARSYAVEHFNIDTHIRSLKEHLYNVSKKI